MNPRKLFIGLSVGGLLIAGCTTPQQTAKPVPPAPKPVPAPAAPQPPPPEVTETPQPVVTPEAQAVVEALTEPTEGGLAHEITETTGFPQAMASLKTGADAPTVEQPQNYATQPPTRGLTADGASAELVERDWTGVVLVPVNAEYSRLYTALVQLTSIEAHPLTDGRVRIWTRVRNATRAPVQVGVACSFVMQDKGEPTPPRFYSLDIPVGGYRDVFFVSGVGKLTNYTVLVKAGN